MLVNPAHVSEAGVGVVVERFDGRMAHDSFDDVDIDLGFEQMTDKRVAHVMRGKAFAGDAGAVPGGEAEIFLDHGAHAEPSKGETSLVDEEAIGSGGFGLAAMMDPIELEKFDGRRPQRIDPLFVALAGNCDGPVGEVEPGDPGVGGLAGARASVVEENENGQVTDAVAGRSLGLGKEGLELLVGQRLAVPLGHALGWNGQDALGVGTHAGLVQREIFEERLDSGKALVASTRRTAPPPVRVFQMLKESKDCFGVDVLKAKGAVWMPGADKGDEKLEGITVAVDRVDAHAPLPTQIDVEESVKMAVEIFGHRRLKARERAS